MKSRRSGIGFAHSCLLAMSISVLAQIKKSSTLPRTRHSSSTNNGLLDSQKSKNLRKPFTIICDSTKFASLFSANTTLERSFSENLPSIKSSMYCSDSKMPSVVTMSSIFSFITIGLNNFISHSYPLSYETAPSEGVITRKFPVTEGDMYSLRKNADGLQFVQNFAEKLANVTEMEALMRAGHRGKSIYRRRNRCPLRTLDLPTWRDLRVLNAPPGALGAPASRGAQARSKTCAEGTRPTGEAAASSAGLVCAASRLPGWIPRCAAQALAQARRCAVGQPAR